MKTAGALGGVPAVCIFEEGRAVNEIIFLVHEPPEGGYAAEALGQSIFTVADSLEELNEMVRDAVICHFDEADRAKIIRLHFVREEVIAV